MKSSVKKAVIFLLLLSAFAADSHALSFFQRMRYKEVDLASDMKVLITRANGKVAYVWKEYAPGEPCTWIPVSSITDDEKDFYQVLLNSAPASK